MSLHRATYAAEQELQSSGLSCTVVRPASYVETWTEVVGAKLAAGGPALVFGRADNPVNFVSVREVARSSSWRSPNRSCVVRSSTCPARTT